MPPNDWEKDWAEEKATNAEKGICELLLISEKQAWREEMVKKIEKDKDNITTGLVYLSDGFPPEKQWEASEAHAEIIIKRIINLIKENE